MLIEILIGIMVILIIPMIIVGFIAFIGLCYSLYHFLRYELKNEKGMKKGC